ncbi:TonB-dependent receptor [Roseateles sp. DAIF2]|uniref:TonB-dependent receptor n=1 Tax=Roseateles sp. DAIF2 TaxID=2714952 RepID=UPI0018A24D0F|nr:TonB-dependent receptor [Roseateles sp. DAIF2]QPF75496.1 TonB-dependent receptor [Roseateles sp. DAIF2]
MPTVHRRQASTFPSCPPRPTTWAVLGLLAGFALPAQANESGASTSLQRVELTGSRIKRLEAESVAPITTISREDIERSGSATLAELLRRLSANPGNSNDETLTSSWAPGAAGVGLRGLGQKNTLVLLNGRRLPVYGFAQNLQDSFVDLNSIPTSAVERVDVLKDGASALYGSDAIAGVINIITRREVKQRELNLSVGQATEGGGRETNASLTGSLASADKGLALLASLDLFQRQGVLASERDFTRAMDFRAYPGGTLKRETGGGTLSLPQGERRALPGCDPAERVDAALLNPATRGTVCGINLAPYFQLSPEARRANGFARASLQLPGALEAFAELHLSHTDTRQTFPPSTFFDETPRFDPVGGGVRWEDVKLPVGHRLNPQPQAATVLRYSFRELGPQNQTIVSDSHRLLAGLKGSFGGAAAPYDWELALGTARNRIDNTQYNRVNWQELVTVIRDGSYDFDKPANSAALQSRLRLNPKREASSSLQTLDARISGELPWQAPAGPIGFAAGVDLRRERMQERPDAVLAAGLVSAQGTTAVDGQREVGALFGELSLPLTKSLELGLAGRQDHYSDFGGRFSPKLSLRWQPDARWLLRGSYAAGFRAPTLPENAQSGATSFSVVRDPKTQDYATIAVVYAGNPQLRAETSKSYNLGLVFAPRPGSQLSLDAYRVEQRHVVGQDSLDDILAQEGQSAVAGKILRSQQGNLLTVISQYVNQGRVAVQGVDLGAQHLLRLDGLGELKLGADWGHLASYKRSAGVDGPYGDNLAGSNMVAALPRNKGSLWAQWQGQDWHLRAQLASVGGFRQTRNAAQREVGSWTTVDLHGGWQLRPDLRLSASLQNLLDRDPPFDASTLVGFNTSQAHLRGRFARVGAQLLF